MGFSPSRQLKQILKHWLTLNHSSGVCCSPKAVPWHTGVHEALLALAPSLSPLPLSPVICFVLVLQVSLLSPRPHLSLPFLPSTFCSLAPDTT